MAFQLQALPYHSPVNPYDEIIKGYGTYQKAQTNKLEQDKMRTENKYLDQKIMAEINALLAGTSLSEQQTIGLERENQLMAQYGEQQLLNEMNYKNAIGRSSLANAEVAEMNAALAAQALPGQMAQTQMNNLKMQQDMVIQSAILQSMATGKPIEQILSGMGYGSMAGDLTSAEVAGGQPDNQYLSNAQLRGQPSNNPDDYITPSKPETISLVDNKLNQFKSPQQIEGEKAEYAEEGRQKVRSYHDLEKEVGDAARNVFDENAMIDMLINTHGEIPYWNKEELGGLLPPIAQKSKLFESLLSGSTISVLGDLKGVASDFDAKMVREVFGGRTFDEINLKELLYFKEVLNDRKVEYQKFVANNKGKSRGEIESDWNSYLKDNSIFDSQKWQDHIKYKIDTASSPEEAELIMEQELLRRNAHEKEVMERYGIVE